MTAEGQISTPAEGSAVPEPSAPNVVHLPDGHTVTLEPETTPTIAIAVLALINEGATSQAAMIGKLGALYLDLSIIDWDYAERDPKTGELYKVPITPAAIRERITVRNGATEVSEVADGLYWQDISVPLAPRLERSSQRMRMASLIPTTSDSGSAPQKPSTPSSRNGTAGPQRRR